MPENQFHNIVTHFDVLPNFSSTANQMMSDYYLETMYIRVCSQVAKRLKI